MKKGGNERFEKVLVVNDVHVPYHDKRLLELFKEFAEDFAPDWLIINGDFLDCAEISKFARVPGKNRTLMQELETGRSVLQEMREAVGKKCRITYIEGNHEFRIKSYLMHNAPELYVLPGLTMQQLLELESMKIEWIGTADGASHFIDTYVAVGKLSVGHFDRVSKHAAYTVKALVEEKGVSILQGHVHRYGVHSKRLMDGTQLMGIENPCMAKLNPDYVANPNWQQGWTVIYHKRSSGRFHAYPIQVVNGGFIWNGKLYDNN